MLEREPTTDPTHQRHYHTHTQRTRHRSNVDEAALGGPEQRQKGLGDADDAVVIHLEHGFHGAQVVELHGGVLLVWFGFRLWRWGSLVRGCVCMCMSKVPSCACVDRYAYLQQPRVVDDAHQRELLLRQQRLHLSEMRRMLVGFIECRSMVHKKGPSHINTHAHTYIDSMTHAPIISDTHTHIS